MKNRIFLFAILLLIVASSCEKMKYHVYSIEVKNSTNREVRFVTEVKVGVGSDGYIAAGADTLLYTERRMSKDFDGPAAFLSEYFSIISMYFSGVSEYVIVSDVSDPTNLKGEYNFFVHDDAWDFEIREVRVPDKGWPDENYFYTINITEDKLLIDLTK